MCPTLIAFIEFGIFNSVGIRVDSGTWFTLTDAVAVGDVACATIILAHLPAVMMSSIVVVTVIIGSILHFVRFNWVLVVGVDGIDLVLVVVVHALVLGQHRVIGGHFVH